MSLGFTLTQDGISPSLARLASSTLERDFEDAGAVALAALAVRAFDEASLRPSTWPARKKPAPHPLLILSGNLRQSINSSGNEIRISAPYAAAHQLGSTKRSIPARPYFPADKDGNLTDDAIDALNDVMDALVGAAA